MTSFVRAGSFFAAVIATVGAAAALPVSIPRPPPLLPVSDGLLSVGPAPPPEELGAFLASRRWGVPPPAPEPLLPTPAPVSPPSPPVTVPPRLVGILEGRSGPVVLFILSDGSVVRLALGDALPDGRRVLSVRRDVVVVRRGGGSNEILRLFPASPAHGRSTSAP